MRRLKAALLAHRGAGADQCKEGEAKLLSLVDVECVEIVNTEAELLFFLSGGSEALAVDMLKPDKFYVLLACKEGNSFASATEVKAYANQRGIRTVLLDYDQPETAGFLKKFTQVMDGLHRLKGQRLGLIGEVSEWLAASTIAPERLQEKLGIELQRFPWNSLENFQEQDADTALFENFHSSHFNLQDTAKVYRVLRNCIRTQRLDAITVECFSLVVEHAVTACLPLAQLNTDGLPAGCEGDICSATGMMLVRALTGLVPWIANTVHVGDSHAIFAHCTAPLNLLRDFSIVTHFETGQGTAIRGQWEADDVLLFRLDATLTKAFLTRAEVLERPQLTQACRTQIEVALRPDAATALRERPLGNHHLILPADYADVLNLACRVLGLELQ